MKVLLTWALASEWIPRGIRFRALVSLIRRGEVESVALASAARDEGGT